MLQNNHIGLSRLWFIYTDESATQWAGPRPSEMAVAGLAAAAAKALAACTPQRHTSINGSVALAAEGCQISIGEG